MTAVSSRPRERAPVGRRRQAEPPRESAVYDGSRLLGVIKPAAGAFVARCPMGQKIGDFPDARSAMRAICAAARGRAEAAG